MKAKCPYCESGCQKCDSGFIQAHMHSGTWWYAVCSNRETCAFVNAGHATEGEFPKEAPQECVVCGSPTEWMTEVNVPETQPWSEPENRLTAERRSHERSLTHFRELTDKLRDLVLEVLNGKTELTLADCQNLRICRLCHKPETAPFQYNYGTEYAHTQCLENETLFQKQIEQNSLEAIKAVKEYILGKPFDEMVKLCNYAGWALRPSRIDGSRMVGTVDYKPNRINVEVDDGIITKAGR